MNGKMRILIAYDGSDCARAGLDDLRRAGLPREGEALIVSVGDVLVSHSASISEIAGTALISGRVTAAVAQAQAQALQALEEARRSAAQASNRVQAYFPEWQVRATAFAGTPSQVLIQKADQWDADLILVGSHGRSALGRFFLGSVSRKVATEARCSVRVARRGVEESDDAPLRLIMGVDGSSGAERVVRAVGRRVWPDGTEVCVTAVDDGASPTRIADIVPTEAVLMTGCKEEAAVRARTMVEWAAQELRAIGLNVSVEIKEGGPRRTLIEEAKLWGADCIFVGARGFNSTLERFLAGSVSTGLATNAPCSVEVVR
ncbi:MAG: universal stress protein [Acidobacteriota bacterium]|nr:universal stress protein [Acidobacteriota bacterium]